jgi:hypothetical protein
MNVTYLSNIMSTKSSFKTPFELLNGEKPELHDYLKMFGEVGVATTKEKIQAKLSNRGTTCMFVGYTEHQSRDVYRILTPVTPRFKIQRSTINMDVLDPQSQMKYRSGVGILLY